MAGLISDVWRAMLASSTDSRSQIIRYSILPQLKTALLCFVACTWDFYKEVARPATCNSRISWRTWLLIAPQATLIAAYVLQLVLMLRFRNGLKVVIQSMTLLLIPLAFLAMVHTVFRASVSLCCCSELLCPLSAPQQKGPSTKVCALFFSNCYWALLRKITHFAATMGMLSPLITLRLSVYLVNAQEQAARTHIAEFFKLLK